MDNALMNTAASNFDRAQWVGGSERMGLVMLGLTQAARAMRESGRDSALLDVAARNFNAGAFESDAERQLQLMTLGLTQFARGLKGR